MGILCRWHTKPLSILYNLHLRFELSIRIICCILFSIVILCVVCLMHSVNCTATNFWRPSALTIFTTIFNGMLSFRLHSNSQNSFHSKYPWTFLKVRDFCSLFNLLQVQYNKRNFAFLMHTLFCRVWYIFRKVYKSDLNAHSKPNLTEVIKGV